MNLLPGNAVVIQPRLSWNKKRSVWSVHKIADNRKVMQYIRMMHAVDIFLVRSSSKSSHEETFDTHCMILVFSAQVRGKALS